MDCRGWYNTRETYSDKHTWYCWYLGCIALQCRELTATSALGERGSC